jgi:hypothetical protein
LSNPDRYHPSLESACRQAVDLAEDRARIAVDAATARATARVEQTDRRARKLVEMHQDQALELCRRIQSASRLPPGNHRKGRSSTDLDNSAVQDPVPDHQTIAMRAYFKAEQRQFAPGHETNDWLQAEQELKGIRQRNPTS